MNAFINVATTLGPRPVDVIEDLGALVITANSHRHLWDSNTYLLTHRATGYAITGHRNRRELAQFARELLRDFDWDFTDPGHAKTLTGVPFAIAAWIRRVAK